MSHTKNKSLLQKILSTRSFKGFSFNFIKNTMFGQKTLLYNTKLPRVINISMNEHTCMNMCRMCPYAEQDVREQYRRKSEMSWETLKNIVASIPNDPFFSFDISAIGETLEFNHLADFIRYMKQERPLVNTIISTNAVLLSETIMQKLIESGLDSMQLSLYAQNRDDYKWLTQKDYFDRIVGNIEKAIKVRSNLKSSTPYLQIFMIEAEELKASFEKFLQDWNGKVDHAFIRPVYNLGRDHLNGLTPLKDMNPQNRYPCVAPFYSTAIASNGDVLACYVFHWNKEHHVIGNINRSTLTEIWNSDDMKKFRAAHMNLDFSEYPGCKDCNLWRAYTNIWDKNTAGYSFRRRFTDLLSSATQHWGG